jgi:integrase
LLPYSDFRRFRQAGWACFPSWTSWVRIPSPAIKNLEDAVRPLRELFEDERVVDFGPVSLKTVRQAMLSAKLSRRVINARVNRIRRVFKWGVENELVGPEILHALQAVAPLKKGRSSAPERREVQPVPQQHIDAVRALVSSPVRAMIDLQLLTGMRPGEVVIMRPRDIDRNGARWRFMPSVVSAWSGLLPVGIVSVNA